MVCDLHQPISLRVNMDKVSNTVSTESVSDAERFSYWREIVTNKILCLDIKRVSAESPFSGSIKLNRIGELQFAFVQSVPQIADRSSRQISMSTEDTSFLCFATSGQQKLTSNSFEKVLNPGDWVMLHNLLPYRWSFPGSHTQLNLKIPNSKIVGWANLENLDSIPYFSGKSGVGKIVFETVCSIWNEVERIGKQISLGLEDLIVELLANILTETIPEKRNLLSSQYLRRMEIKSFIKDHLQNPDLSAGFIAESFRISKRYLYSLFEDEDMTIGSYIRVLRLVKCKRDIENPLLNDRTISEICFFWGFSDFSHFSKLFKKQFGISPRDCRYLSQNISK